MKERPILFNAEMVKAILSGRKTQTRRIVKPQFISDKQLIKKCDDGEFRWWIDGAEKPHGAPIYSKQGKVGDQLWVRETFSKLDEFEFFDPAVPEFVPDHWYWSDGNPTWGNWSRPKPSIHMPRAASRIDLLITGVRVERLNSISEQDAQAEGATTAVWFAKHGVPEEDWETLTPGPNFPATHINGFASIWDSIYQNWDENPWVWVIEFERIGGDL